MSHRTRKGDPMSKSKIFGFLEFIAHIAGLNILFLLCCLPVITIGASLTALYAGLRSMAKKEPCFRAFWGALRKSFLRATLAWIVLLPINVFFISNVVFNCYYLSQGSVLALIVSILFAALLLSITTTVFLFYSRFEASLLQLLRYGVSLFFSYPLRSMLIALFTWAPFLLLFLTFPVFFLLGMVWLFFYFALVSLAAIWLMNQPFRTFARDVLGMDVPTPTETEE